MIYKGDASAWLKTAYGLKARYTMRLMGRSADVKGDMEKVLDYVSKSYTSQPSNVAMLCMVWVLISTHFSEYSILV